MYLRTTKKRTSAGNVVESLQIVESLWDRDRQRSVVDEILLANPDWKVVNAWPFGEVYVLEQLWRRIGFPDLLPAQIRDATRRLLPVERACFAMVANRCCAPSSKLYCFEQWLKDDVRIPGTDTLGLTHLYRSMDFFEKNEEDIEKALYVRVADLLNVDVQLVFYDTTTLPCEIDEEDAGGRDDVVVHGSKLAGGKEYEAHRQ